MMKICSGVGAAILAIATLSGAAAAAENATRAQECGELVDKLFQNKILYGAQLRGGAIELVVDRGAWQGIDFSAKERMVQTVVCVAMKGDPEKTLPITVRDNMRNAVVGRYDGLTLKVVD